MNTGILLVDATVVVATGTAAFLARRAPQPLPAPQPFPPAQPLPPAQRLSPTQSLPAPPVQRPLRRPETALAAVTALIYVNQVLFTVYILRVHGGDTSFIARLLPDGWFALADHNPALRRLAELTPAPGLLSPTLLRVQAFLELPFVLLAFMTGLGRLDPALQQRTARSRLIPLAAASYTAVFCIVEWNLRNPYTVQDIAVRVLSALLTPALVAATARRPSVPRRPVDAAGLLLFSVDLLALGSLVLTVYDTALLYNLGHLGAQLPGAAVALAVLTATALLRGRFAVRPAVGPTTGALAEVLTAFLLLFLVPALPIRYCLNFGTTALGAAAAGLLLVLAAAPAVRRGGAVALRLALAGAVALAAARWAGRLAAGLHSEAALLAAAATGLLTTVACCAAADVLQARHARRNSG